MIPLIHDDGKELDKNIWIEDIWDGKVGAIFTDEVVELVARAHRELANERAEILKEKGASDSITSALDWDKTIQAYQSNRYPIRSLTKVESCFLVDGDPVCATIIDFVISTKKGHRIKIDEQKLDELERKWFDKLNKVVA